MEFLILIFYYTSLHNACESGNVDVFKYLYSSGKFDMKPNILFVLLISIFFYWINDILIIKIINQIHQ